MVIWLYNELKTTYTPFICGYLKKKVAIAPPSENLPTPLTSRPAPFAILCKTS